MQQQQQPCQEHHTKKQSDRDWMPPLTQSLRSGTGIDESSLAIGLYAKFKFHQEEGKVSQNEATSAKGESG